MFILAMPFLNPLMTTWIAQKVWYEYVARPVVLSYNLNMFALPRVLALIAPPKFDLEFLYRSRRERLSTRKFTIISGFVLFTPDIVVILCLSKIFSSPPHMYRLLSFSSIQLCGFRTEMGNLLDIPKSAVVYGGGVIAVEYATGSNTYTCKFSRQQ